MSHEIISCLILLMKEQSLDKDKSWVDQIACLHHRMDGKLRHPTLYWLGWNEECRREKSWDSKKHSTRGRGIRSIVDMAGGNRSIVMATVVRL